MSSSKATKNSQAPKPKNKLLLSALFALSATIGGSSAYYSLSQKSLPSWIPITTPSVWDFETKIKLFSQFAMYSGVLVFVSSFLVMMIRLTLNSFEPARQEDPRPVALANLILRNNIEQMVLFLANFLYWIIDKAQEGDLQLLYCFGFFFIGYRILFMLGYLTGMVMNTTLLREIGFTGTMVVNMFLLTKNFGLNLI